jgi:ArsR family transcriptional regulator, virulence genes transcriptional regulator
LRSASSLSETKHTEWRHLRLDRYLLIRGDDTGGTKPVARKRKSEMSYEIFERQARICKAFAHPGRLQILDSLGSGEKGIGDLQTELEISKTGMSQHIAILKSVGVITTRRSGKQIYCSLAMPEVKQACQLIRKVLHAQITGSHRLIQ